MVKVADFGLARDVYKDDTYIKVSPVSQLKFHSVFHIRNIGYFCRVHGFFSLIQKISNLFVNLAFAFANSRAILMT